MSEKTGTFVVTHAEDESAVVRDVDTAQVHTLASNPGLEVHDVLEATVAPEPPLDVAWEVIDVEDRRSIDLVDSDLEPTQHERELAADSEVGDLVQEERAGTGEIHVFCVSEGEVEPAAQDVLADEETIARAAQARGGPRGSASLGRRRRGERAISAGLIGGVGGRSTRYLLRPMKTYSYGYSPSVSGSSRRLGPERPVELRRLTSGGCKWSGIWRISTYRK